VVERADPEQTADGQAVDRDGPAGAGAESRSERDEDRAGHDRAEEGEQVQPAAHPGPGVGVVPVLVGEVGGGPDVLDGFALVEDGGHGVGPGGLHLGPVGLQPHGTAVVG
jgi:hypothetical protein